MRNLPNRRKENKKGKDYETLDHKQMRRREKIKRKGRHSV